MKKLLLLISHILILFPLIGQTFGNAINLDGMDDYAIVPHHASLNPEDGNWSVAFWIKAADKGQASPVVMKRLPEDPYTQYSYGFGKDDPHNPEPGKRLRVNHIDVPGVSERSGHTTDEYIDGNWHHIVFVANKDQDGIEICVDGLCVEFYPMYYFGSWPNISISNDLIIASGSSGAKVEGPLDELSIWNKALTQANIQEMMYDTLSSEYYTTSDSGLVAYYRFDEFEDLGIGNSGNDDFRDLSIWGNHADSEGNPELIPSDLPVNINYRKVSDFMSIYPNPAMHKFSVLSSGFFVDPYRIELFDLNGRKLFQKDIAGGNEKFEVDISWLQSGIYFCKVNTVHRTMTKKLIKK